MMNQNQIFEKIDELLLKYDDMYSLYHGGCCMAAYEVSKVLEQNMIPFEVLMYVDRASASLKTPEMICESDGCMHIAIVVNYQGNKCSLGVDERCDDLQLKWGAVPKVFKKITAARILKLTDLGKWSGEYDHSHDEEFRRDLEQIVKE